MRNFIAAVLMLMLFTFIAVPAFADNVRDANAAYNELLSSFNGKYPDEYAGAYLDTSSNKLCILLTESHADTTAKLGTVQEKMLSLVSVAYRSNITFKMVKYSYNELLAARDTATSLLQGRGYAPSSVGINDQKNAVDIGIIPDDYAAAIDFVKTNPSLKELPLSIVSAERMSPSGNESPGMMPKTGSNSNTTLWLALMLISVGVLVGTAAFAWKRRKTQ